MSRNVSLDILKLLMSFMVVGLHANFLNDIYPIGGYLTVNGIFRVAVPIFIIVSGFYFYHVISSGKQADWIRRLLTLYVVWMLFYSYFWFSLEKVFSENYIDVFKTMVIGYHHLWYISGMVGSAFLLILICRFSSIVIWFSVLLFFTIGVGIQYVGNYHVLEGEFDNFFNVDWSHRNVLFFSYPFFCVGYLINKQKIHERFTLKSSFCLSVFFLIVLMFESYFNFNQETRDGGFDNYLSLLFVCPFIFIFFINLNFEGEGKIFSLYSSSIYFIHPFILSVLRKLTEMDATFLTFFCILFSVVISYFIVKVNDKIKVIL